MGPDGGHTDTSFVVRLWLERRQRAKEPEWRFEVRHVQSGEMSHGRSLTDLLAFVERHAAVPPPQLCSAPQRADEGAP